LCPNLYPNLVSLTKIGYLDKDQIQALQKLSMEKGQNIVYVYGEGIQVPYRALISHSQMLK
jgi:hypothetical protein